MKRLITICYLLSVTYSLLSAVRTSYGVVEGVHQDGVTCYLGIPYAQPPLGELAGRYPVAPTPWDTVLIADHGRQNEVQPHNRFSTSNMSQDCLYMNVFVPDSLPDSCPVMVWIHGGAYNTGGTGVWSSGHLRFDMSSFARETRTIVVTFNYRLNVFGYLNLHALNPRFDANIGTADQLFALQFVHKQIAAFGGDPSQICLFGQSAGGASVLTLMSLPEAQGLFARAIAMSPCLSHCYTPAESEQRAARFLRCAVVGKQHADKVLTLSDKRLANTGRHFVAQTALSGDVRCAFGPWVDGELIREMPAVGAARCTAPLLIGMVQDEARLFTNMVPKVLYKSADDLPTYHLANIVDDHLMEVTQVIRGEEWLPSAPLHVLLYRAFGWEDTMPQFAHLPLLLKPDGNGKLSKRDGDRLGFPVFPLEFHNQKDGTVSSGYRESGYFPEAVINFLALLGWHNTGDQEMFSMDELIEQFSLDRVSKSGAKFDYEKGKWFNHQYLQNKSNEELAELFIPILEQKLAGQTPVLNGGSTVVDTTVAKVIGLVKDRVNFVPELWEQANFFFVAPTEYDEKSLAKRWKEDSPRHMTELLEVLEGIDESDWVTPEGKTAEEGVLNTVVMKWIADHEYGLGIVMNAFRICLVGAARGPHIWSITDVLGKQETLRRVRTALEKI